MNALMLLDVRELLERLVAVGARVLAHVTVNKRVLRQLLRRRERLETLAAFVSFLLHTMRLLGVTLHVRLVGELLRQSRIAFTAKLQRLTALTFTRSQDLDRWYIGEGFRGPTNHNGRTIFSSCKYKHNSTEYADSSLSQF